MSIHLTASFGYGNGGQLSNVSIAELIIYGAAITDDELKAVEKNIAERYGVPYTGATSSSSGIYCGENPNEKVFLQLLMQH